VSLFRIVKYSSLFYFLGRHRGKLFRSAAVLLFALVTSLLYDDLRLYLESQHPESLIYALIAKVAIVYGALAFVIIQFRPRGARKQRGEARAARLGSEAGADRGAAVGDTPGAERLDALADVDRHARLRSRYDRILAGEAHADAGAPGDRGKRSGGR